jgi:hypothetical protein
MCLNALRQELPGEAVAAILIIAAFVCGMLMGMAAAVPP